MAHGVMHPATWLMVRPADELKVAIPCGLDNDALNQRD
jgi:hypothetical protein